MNAQRLYHDFKERGVILKAQGEHLKVGSAALLASSAIVALYERLKERRQGKNVRRYQHYRLNNLNEGENEPLRGYIHNQTRTQYLSMSDGRVGQFEAEKIIFRSTRLGQYPDAFAYNIESWAWDYLNKHPELLSGPESPGPSSTPQGAAEASQDGAQRPWWRRVFRV